MTFWDAGEGVEFDDILTLSGFPIYLADSGSRILPELSDYGTAVTRQFSYNLCLFVKSIEACCYCTIAATEFRQALSEKITEFAGIRR